MRFDGAPLRKPSATLARRLDDADRMARTLRAHVIGISRGGDFSARESSRVSPANVCRGRRVIVTRPVVIFPAVVDDHL